MEKIAIKYMSPEELLAYAFNNKDHPKEQIEFLANSINEFGFNSPVIIDAQNIIIAGHGRVEAAKRLWLKEIPVVQKDNLSPAQVRKYRLLDNKISELAKDNEENIKMELLELADLELNQLYDFALNLNPDDLWEGFGLPDEDKSELCQMTFTLHKDQKDEIEKAMAHAASLGDFDVGMNENKNGNALARVAELFNGRDWSDEL